MDSCKNGVESVRKNSVNAEVVMPELATAE